MRKIDYVSFFTVSGTNLLHKRGMLAGLAKEAFVTMTYKAVQEELRAAGIVMSKKGETHRINFFSGLENTAHYTTSFTMP